MTHDFLITPIHQWLELRSLGTRSGQAQARLEEFAELYHARPKPQSLPTLTEYVTLRRRIKSSMWTEPQKRMMQAARQLHVRHVGIAAACFAFALIVGVSGWHYLQNQRSKLIAENEVERFLATELPTALPQAESFRKSDSDFIKKHLNRYLVDEASDSGKRLRASLVFAPEKEVVVNC